MPFVVFSSKKYIYFWFLEPKLMSHFLAQFCIEGYSTPYGLDRTCKGGGSPLYVSEGIPSEQIKLKFIENEAFEVFFVKIFVKRVASLLPL